MRVNAMVPFGQFSEKSWLDEFNTQNFTGVPRQWRDDIMAAQKTYANKDPRDSFRTLLQILPNAENSSDSIPLTLAERLLARFIDGATTRFQLAAASPEGRVNGNPFRQPLESMLVAVKEAGFSFNKQSPVTRAYDKAQESLIISA